MTTREVTFCIRLWDLIWEASWSRGVNGGIEFDTQLAGRHLMKTRTILFLTIKMIPSVVTYPLGVLSHALPIHRERQAYTSTCHQAKEQTEGANVCHVIFLVRNPKHH